MSGVKLTKAQKSSLALVGEIGPVYPSKSIGSASTFSALVRRGLVEVIGSNPTASRCYRITDAGRSALSTKTEGGE